MGSLQTKTASYILEDIEDWINERNRRTKPTVKIQSSGGWDIITVNFVGGGNPYTYGRSLYNSLRHTLEIVAVEDEIEISLKSDGVVEASIHNSDSSSTQAAEDDYWADPRDADYQEMDWVCDECGKTYTTAAVYLSPDNNLCYECLESKDAEEVKCRCGATLQWDNMRKAWFCIECPFNTFPKKAESFSAEGDKCYKCKTTKGKMYWHGKKGLICAICSEGGVKYRAETDKTKCKVGHPISKCEECEAKICLCDSSCPDCGIIPRWDY